MTFNPTNAIAAGLTYRPLRQTITDTLNWDATLPPNRNLEAGITRAREEDLLKAWAEPPELTAPPPRRLAPDAPSAASRGPAGAVAPAGWNRAHGRKGGEGAGVVEAPRRGVRAAGPAPCPTHPPLDP